MVTKPDELRNRENILCGGVKQPNCRREWSIIRAVVPKDGHECDARVDRRGKGHPTDHSATNGVIDVEQEHEEACEKDEKRKVNDGRQRLNGPGNVKLLDTNSEKCVNPRSPFWRTPTQLSDPDVSTRPLL